MSFLMSHPTLTVIQWTLRAVVGFFFLLLAVKLMRQRSISQLRLIDFIMALTIGNIIAHPLSDPHLNMKGSLVTIFTLVLLYMAGVFFSLKVPAIRKVLEPLPYPLIKNGEIIYRNLGRAQISLDFLLSQLRKEKIMEVHKVALALWEPDGTLSTFLMPIHQTITALDLNLPPQPLNFPAPVIKDGTVNEQELKQTGKDAAWLNQQLHTVYQAHPTDVLLATLDNEENLRVFFYK